MAVGAEEGHERVVTELGVVARFGGVGVRVRVSV